MYAEMYTETGSDERPVRSRVDHRSGLGRVERDVRRVGSRGGSAIDRAGAPARRVARPQPVRPAVAAVPVRPGRAEWPAARVDPPLRVCPNRQRVLARPAAVPVSKAGPARRLLGGLLVVLLAAAVVIGLAELLEVSSAAPAGPGPVAESPVAAPLTVGSERTVWEVAQRLEPAADGPRHAELAERIVVANALTSVELRPGQVLWVPSG